jgi:predicted nucleic acid-binding protein
MTERRSPPGGSLFGDLPDVNVWLAMAVKQHPHHEAAASYWMELAGRRVWFCRVTMLGLVRLLSQPKVMGEQALTLTRALATYQRFAALPEIGLHAEPADCAGQLQRRLSADLPACPLAC